jgi:hypothetical protein
MAEILRISFDEYLARQAFSSSVAKTVVMRSPAHGKSEHEKPPTKAMDRGDIVHHLVLGKGKDFEILQYDSYRTNAAKDARDKARAAGKTPILEEAFAEACVIAERIRVQLADRGIDLDGESELSIEWHEQTEYGFLLCKGRFDHVWLEQGVILDLKVTENAAQSAVERTAENLGYAIQSAAYTRALTALDPDRYAGKVDFLFAFGEAEDPYAMNLCRPDGTFREIGERRWLRAVQTWARCTAENHFPAYGTGINPLSAPGWALAREEYAL